MPRTTPVVTNQSGQTPVRGALSVWGNVGTLGDATTPAARWMGSSLGAPTTGTFKRGDFVLDVSVPCWWVCQIDGDLSSFAPIPSDHVVASPTVLATPHGGRVDWSASNVIAFSQFTSGKNGGEIYTMTPAGGSKTNLTGALGGISHISNDQPAWTPDNAYIVFQSVNQTLYDALPGTTDEKNAIVQGGAGVDNDLWLYKMSDASLTQLTTVSQSEAVLHPHVSPDGTKMFWAARRQVMGTPQWMLVAADFSTAGTPALTNETIYQPFGTTCFYESHNWFADNNRVLFSTDANPTAAQKPVSGITALNIGVLDLTTGIATLLTRTHNVWQEHAQISPDGTSINWISSQGNPFNPSADWQSTLKTDLWRMDADGSHKQQLSFYNLAGSAQYAANTRVIMSDGSWNPTGDRYVMQQDIIASGTVTSRVVVFNFGSAQ